MTHEKMTETFGEVISSYPDSQACEDGILVPVTQSDRVTQACWIWMAANLADSPPDCWAVDMLGWFGADKSESPGDSRALAASKGLIAGFERQARDVWDNNIGGGVFNLYAIHGGGTEIITGLRTEEPEAGAWMVLWLIPNEVGGMTLMFPSDY